MESAAGSDAAEAGAAARGRLGLGVVVFPLPFQGHINPMLQLAALLARRGFSITVVHTRFNAPDPAGHPGFRFAPIDDGLGERVTLDDLPALAARINAACRGPFRSCLARLLGEGDGDPVACVVADALLYSAEAVAAELGVRRVVLRTTSAACFRLFIGVFPTLWEKGYYPIQESRREEEVPEAPPYRVRDLPTLDVDGDDGMREVVSRAVDGARTAAALVINTFEELEHVDLAAVRRDLAIPVFAVGPLHQFSRNASGGRPRSDHGCLAWLDRQHPRSVIYVSFGSLACMERGELEEVARGLAESQQPFLWVLRPGSVRGAAAELPAGFGEETAGRGMVVGWAPQPEVFAHPSVGAFWTHCGWNSVLESLCGGMPMLCWPSFGDQPGNARFVSHVWKVGVVLEGELQRGEVRRAVRTLMAEEEMRMRARKIGEAAERSIQEGGSSHGALDALVYLIRSWS